MITIRYCGSSQEYEARNSTGKVVGSCVRLPEHGVHGLWRYAIPGHGAWTDEVRERALIAFNAKLQNIFNTEEQKAA